MHDILPPPPPPSRTYTHDVYEQLNHQSRVNAQFNDAVQTIIHRKYVVIGTIERCAETVALLVHFFPEFQSLDTDLCKRKKNADPNKVKRPKLADKHRLAIEKTLSCDLRFFAAVNKRLDSQKSVIAHTALVLEKRKRAKLKRAAYEEKVRKHNEERRRHEEQAQEKAWEDMLARGGGESGGKGTKDVVTEGNKAGCASRIAWHRLVNPTSYVSRGSLEHSV